MQCNCTVFLQSDLCGRFIWYVVNSIINNKNNNNSILESYTLLCNYNWYRFLPWLFHHIQDLRFSSLLKFSFYCEMCYLEGGIISHTCIKNMCVWMWIYIHLWNGLSTLMFKYPNAYGSERFLRAGARSWHRHTRTWSSSFLESYCRENWIWPLTLTLPKSPTLYRLIMLPLIYGRQTQSHC